MNKRILELRKALNLTQTEFGTKIGLSRDGIASYERGTAKPTGTAIQAILYTFGVNRVWLETGKGDMFAPSSVDYLDKLAQQHNLGPGGKALLSVAMQVIEQLPEFQSDALLDMLSDMIQTAIVERDADRIMGQLSASESSAGADESTGD